MLGPVRSLRLPHELDAWFEDRLRENPRRSASDLLLELLHGGFFFVDNNAQKKDSMRHPSTLREMLEPIRGACYAGNPDVDQWR